MIYTTNDLNDPTYNSLNDKYKLGPNYWLVELKIDCNKTSIFDAKV